MSDKVKNSANSINNSDDRIASNNKAAERTNSNLNETNRDNNLSLNNILSKNFGSDFSSFIQDLDNLSKGRVFSVAANSKNIDKSAVDYLLQLDDKTYKSFEKIIKVIHFKLDLDTCNAIQNKINRNRADLVVKVAKCGFKIKSGEDLVAIINNIKS